MEKLRDYLNQTNLNQGHFASAVDISQGYLSDLAAGKKRPSLTLALKIEQATGGMVPVQCWVQGANDNTNAAGEATPA